MTAEYGGLGEGLLKRESERKISAILRNGASKNNVIGMYTSRLWIFSLRTSVLRIWLEYFDDGNLNCVFTGEWFFALYSIN